MFRSDLMESMSHIPWWLVLVVWVPIVAGLFGVAHARLGLPLGPAVGWAAAGLFLWTFTEYALHRFAFHHRVRTALGRRIHFLAHGIHHLDPWDGSRLVFPPLAGILIALPIFGLFHLALPLPAAMAAMAGLLVGYITYDMVHYFTHHGKPRGPIGKFLKRYHLAHHHKEPHRMYGVSNPLWDVVFRTGAPRREKRAAE
jgi:sterol desaturase/sphingolipid hydroxylase (fatty acid hydroxylase superfamily)